MAGACAATRRLRPGFVRSHAGTLRQILRGGAAKWPTHRLGGKQTLFTLSPVPGAVRIGNRPGRARVPSGSFPRFFCGLPREQASENETLFILPMVTWTVPCDGYRTRFGPNAVATEHPLRNSNAPRGQRGFADVDTDDAVATRVRIAARMASGNEGHAASRADRSASAMPPSQCGSLRPPLRPLASVRSKLRLERGFGSLPS
jgi:hypothetical protein